MPAVRSTPLSDLPQIVAVVEDDAEPGAQRLRVPAEGGDFIDVQVAVLDLADPAGCDAHEVGDLALRESEPLAFLGEVEGADPRLGPCPLRVQRVDVAVVELGADVVPVVELGHESSLLLRSN